LQGQTKFSQLFPENFSRFVRVMENLESHGMLEFDFPGLEGHAN